MSTEDRLVSFVRSGPGHVTVTLPRLCGPESLHVAAAPAREAGRNSRDVCPGKRERGAEVGSPQWRLRGVTSRVGGKGAMETEGAPGGRPTVSWWGHRSCSHIYSRVGPKGETDYRDVRWTRSLKGTVELLRGQKAAVHPQGWKSKERVTQRQGAAPHQGLEGKGETRYFQETRGGLHPPMPLGICWNLSRAGLNRTPWEQPGLSCPSPHLRRTQLPRQAEGQTQG